MGWTGWQGWLEGVAQATPQSHPCHPIQYFGHPKIFGGHPLATLLGWGGQGGESLKIT